MKNKGFTLIEVICTVAIIGIITSIAMPISLRYINESKEKRYLVEGKLIESSVDMYNFENPNSQIRRSDSLESIKQKLSTIGGRYLQSWPKNISVLYEGECIKAEENNLSRYTYEDLLKYSRKIEDKIE
ncbi:MAG: type II secretion system protein [Clostridium sp.]|uniref:type II secretion system protein n=1 Tax=Clostridium sp. TaxID=1506 RepID=UPI002FC8C0BE